MNILHKALETQTKFISMNTGALAIIVTLVLFGRKLLTGEFGSPDFVAIMLSIPVTVFLGSIVLWNLFFKSNPFSQKREK